MKLAIQGHQTRGKEIIELLEMLGGVNLCGYDGNRLDRIYYISECRSIFVDDNYDIDFKKEIGGFVIFTLEEFEQKFPYKVGDKVKYINNIFCIKSAQWDNEKNTVIYYIDADWSAGYVVEANDLQSYKEEAIEDKLDLLQQLKDYFESTPREVIEKEWHKYDKYNEISPKVSEYLEYVNNIRQPKYPKTYIECAKILDRFSTTYIDGYKNALLEKLQELLICRDAYWKIAGKEMGLNESWKPTPDTFQTIYVIRYTKNNGKEGWDKNEIENTSFRYILSFPTKEMRDAFYENFKDLIEQCKELL